jgi:hypothetical protein
VAYTGGIIQARCLRPNAPPAVMRGRLTVTDGEVVVSLGQEGRPGHVSLRGRPESDGTLVLAGFVIPGAGRAGAGRGRGDKLAARFEGRLANGRGTLAGNQGPQRCTIAVMLK